MKRHGRGGRRFGRGEERARPSLNRIRVGAGFEIRGRFEVSLTATTDSRWGFDRLDFDLARDLEKFLEAEGRGGVGVRSTAGEKGGWSFLRLGPLKSLYL